MGNLEQCTETDIEEVIARGAITTKQKEVLFGVYRTHLSYDSIAMKVGCTPLGARRIARKTFLKLEYALASRATDRFIDHQIICGVAAAAAGC